MHAWIKGIVSLFQQGIDQFDDIGPSVVMASPGMMQVCAHNIGTSTLFLIFYKFMNLTGSFIISITCPLQSGDTLNMQQIIT